MNTGIIKERHTAAPVGPYTARETGSLNDNRMTVWLIHDIDGRPIATTFDRPVAHHLTQCWEDISSLLHTSDQLRQELDTAKERLTVARASLNNTAKDLSNVTKDLRAYTALYGSLLKGKDTPPKE